MNLLNVIIRVLGLAGGVSAENMRKLVADGVAANPDLADEGQLVLDALDRAATPEFAETLRGEAENILNLKFDPRDHASDG